MINVCSNVQEFGDRITKVKQSAKYFNEDKERGVEAKVSHVASPSQRPRLIVSYGLTDDGRLH